jgi:hypothetical protein
MMQSIRPCLAPLACRCGCAPIERAVPRGIAGTSDPELACRKYSFTNNDAIKK